MRVLILGGGSVGSAVARRQRLQSREVTVVERDPVKAKILDDELDVRVICDEASRASALFRANASSMDFCFALTGDDETNILGASVAKAMGARRVAARVYSPVFRDLGTFDYARHFNVDRLLSIEHLTAMEIARRIKEPGATLVEHFGDGEIEMQDVFIVKESSLTRKPLADLRLPSDVRVGAINRGGNIVIASAVDHIEVGDRVTLLGDRLGVENLKKRLLTQSIRKQNVVVAGGGETGYHVATALEKRNYNVKILERRRERCEFLAQRLSRTTVVFGDARRKNFLDEQRAGDADVFIACAGDDENNIMSCVEAKTLGAAVAVAVVSHSDYADVVGKLGIDETVSPYDVIERQVEGLTRQGALIFQNSRLLGGDVEVVELEVEEGSPITRAPLRDLRVPKPTLIAGVARENAALTPSPDFIFRPNDCAVALAMRENLAALVKMFEKG